MMLKILLMLEMGYLKLTTAFNIREYEVKDQEGVIKLWNMVFPDMPSWNNPNISISKKLEVQRELFFVAHDNHNIIGTVMAGYDGHRGWIYFLAVHPDYRRIGVGKALTKRAEEALTQMGCVKVNLQIRSDNKEVVNFYMKTGYSIEDRISMGKRLEEI